MEADQYQVAHQAPSPRSRVTSRKNGRDHDGGRAAVWLAVKYAMVAAHSELECSMVTQVLLIVLDNGYHVQTLRTRYMGQTTCILISQHYKSESSSR